MDSSQEIENPYLQISPFNSPSGSRSGRAHPALANDEDVPVPVIAIENPYTQIFPFKSPSGSRSGRAHPALTDNEDVPVPMTAIVNPYTQISPFKAYYGSSGRANSALTNDEHLSAPAIDLDDSSKAHSTINKNETVPTATRASSLSINGPLLLQFTTNEDEIASKAKSPSPPAALQNQLSQLKSPPKLCMTQIKEREEANALRKDEALDDPSTLHFTTNEDGDSTSSEDEAPSTAGSPPPLAPPQSPMSRPMEQPRLSITQTSKRNELIALAKEKYKKEMAAKGQQKSAAKKLRRALRNTDIPFSPFPDPPPINLLAFRNLRKLLSQLKYGELNVSDLGLVEDDLTWMRAELVELRKQNREERKERERRENVARCQWASARKEAKLGLILDEGLKAGSTIGEICDSVEGPQTKWEVGDEYVPAMIEIEQTPDQKAAAKEELRRIVMLTLEEETFTHIANNPLFPLFMPEDAEKSACERWMDLVSNDLDDGFSVEQIVARYGLALPEGGPGELGKMANEDGVVGGVEDGEDGVLVKAMKRIEIGEGDKTEEDEIVFHGRLSTDKA